MVLMCLHQKQMGTLMNAYAPSFRADEYHLVSAYLQLLLRLSARLLLRVMRDIRLNAHLPLLDRRRPALSGQPQHADLVRKLVVPRGLARDPALHVGTLADEYTCRECIRSS